MVEFVAPIKKKDPTHVFVMSIKVGGIDNVLQVQEPAPTGLMYRGWWL